jgi:hypothetical protein
LCDQTIAIVTTLVKGVWQTNGQTLCNDTAMIDYEAHFPETGRKKIVNTLGYKSDRYEVKSQRIGENNSC